MTTDAQCGACGETNPSDSAFCLMCGTYLGWNVTAPASSTSPEPVSSATAQESPSDEREHMAAPGTPVATAPTQPTPVTPPPPPPQAPALPLCAECGRPNDAERRFCARCGHLLGSAAPAPTAGHERRSRSGWWWWARDPRERAARRDYRRSLPTLYRWRRVLLGALAVALLAGLAIFLTGDPFGAAKRRWWALTDATQALEVTATSRPPAALRPGYEPANVVDGKADTAWSTMWNGTDAPDGCKRGGDAAVLQLSWDGDAQVRRIRVRVGLQAGETERFQQFVPAVLGVRYGDRGCERVELADDAGWQERPLELDEAVDGLTITVVEASPPATEPFIPVVTIRDIQLLARPR